jgi:TonB family protein
MRMLVPALAVLGLMAAGGCATQKTYETVLNVCSSGNGTVKTASVVKSSGDPAVDQHAINTVAKSMVYEESSQLTCKPLTVEYKLTGQAA